MAKTFKKVNKNDQRSEITFSNKHIFLKYLKMLKTTLGMLKPFQKGNQILSKTNKHTITGMLIELNIIQNNIKFYQINNNIKYIRDKSEVRQGNQDIVYKNIYVN